MSLFDRFKRRDPIPPPKPLPVVPLALALQPASDVRPLPLSSTDPIDNDINRRWLEFQRTNKPATWDAFLADLQAQIARTDQTIARVTADIADYDPDKAS